MTLRTIVLATACAVAFSAAAQADETAPANLVNQCAACHGPGGKSPGPIPAIAGKTEAELAQKLTAFKAGKATDATPTATVMTRLVQGYSDAEVAAIAKYVAANWK